MRGPITSLKPRCQEGAEAWDGPSYLLSARCLFPTDSSGSWFLALLVHPWALLQGLSTLTLLGHVPALSTQVVRPRVWGRASEAPKDAELTLTLLLQHHIQAPPPLWGWGRLPLPVAFADALIGKAVHIQGLPSSCSPLTGNTQPRTGAVGRITSVQTWYKEYS